MLVLFTNFMPFSVFMPFYDRVLILEDFNIHVCCPSSFTTDFIHLFESFNLVQSVKGLSHNKGHTLDLVLSRGVSLNNLHMLDIPVSDHKAVTFQTHLPPPVPKPHSPVGEPLSQNFLQFNEAKSEILLFVQSCFC